MKKRVKIPVSDAQALLALARKVRDKHVVDGDASPLKALNWAELNQLIDEAVTTEEQATVLKREKRRVYQSRGRKMEALRSMVRRSRDILTGVYRDEMKQLGSWGFDVLDNKVIPVELESDEIAKTS